MSNLSYIRCTIERGAFTNERTFEIDLSSSVVYQGQCMGRLVGTAHASHLRNARKEPLGDEPQYGEKVQGFVACNTIRELPHGKFVVEVPSADVIHVSKDSLVQAE